MSEDWSDEEFLEYVEIHCHTPRAIFSGAHTMRLYKMAGYKVISEGYFHLPEGQTYRMSYDVALSLVKIARERLMSRNKNGGVTLYAAEGETFEVRQAEDDPMYGVPDVWAAMFEAGLVKYSSRHELDEEGGIDKTAASRGPVPDTGQSRGLQALVPKLSARWNTLSRMISSPVVVIDDATYDRLGAEMGRQGTDFLFDAQMNPWTLGESGDEKRLWPIDRSTFNKWRLKNKVWESYFYDLDPREQARWSKREKVRMHWLEHQMFGDAKK